MTQEEKVEPTKKSIVRNGVPLGRIILCEL